MKLMQIIVDGEVVLEMPVYVYDGRKAWMAFLSTFAKMEREVVGELFETMRMVCATEPPPDSVMPALLINIKTQEAALV